MINNVTLMGRLTATPEIAMSKSGTDYVRFCLANNRGDENKITDFIDCVAWNKTAQFICKYFEKGSLIAVEGNIRTSSYEDGDGNKRKSTDVFVNRAHFTGEKKNQTESPSADIAQDDDGGLPF